jgi:hypothetical protein
MLGPEVADDSATDDSDRLRNLRKKLQDASATGRSADGADLKRPSERYMIGSRRNSSPYERGDESTE